LPVGALGFAEENAAVGRQTGVKSVWIIQSLKDS